jgi:V-type H+-transporting ATPase subunit E
MAAMSQVAQMTEFITNEAKDKAEEIDAKALQEFSIEKFRILNQSKEKLRQDFQRKAKQQETQRAIERSTAINKSRLEKIKARQEAIGGITSEAKKDLTNKLKDDATNKKFITNLIVQGLLMLLEDTVQVRCRAQDDAVVSACLAQASAQYAQEISSQTGASKAVKLSLDTANKLPTNCLGGVILACAGNSITIDNTIDARLNHVMEQAKPNIRKLMFGK